MIVPIIFTAVISKFAFQKFVSNKKVFKKPSYKDVLLRGIL